MQKKKKLEVELELKFQVIVYWLEGLFKFRNTKKGYAKSKLGQITNFCFFTRNNHIFEVISLWKWLVSEVTVFPN